MNTQTQEALNMAITELEKGEGWMDNVSETIQACKEALEQPAQEPVAWIKYVWKPYEEEDPDDDGFYPDIDLDTYDNGGDPLYTHPAPEQNEFAKTKSWQGLSDDEIQEELKKMWDKGLIPSYSIVAFARAIEQALKEKNI